MSNLLLLFAVCGIGLGWFYQDRELRKRIFELESIEREIQINLDDNTVYWKFNQSMLKNVPTWDDRTTPPPVDFLAANQKCDFIVKNLDHYCDDVKIGNWKLTGLELVSLEQSSANKDHWCYLAKFTGMEKSKREPVRFSAMILMDGTVYRSSYANSDNTINVESAMKSVFPLPPIQ